MNRTVNRVMLIGYVDKKPELNYTNKNIAVTHFDVVTTRTWGKDRSETTKTRCIAWDRLAEICTELLHEGTDVYIDGRLSNSNFVDSDGVDRTRTEVVITEMIKLDDSREEDAPYADIN